MADLVALAPGVFLHTLSTERKNSVVLASISEAFLIDPAWTPSDLDDLAEELADRGLCVTGGFATHAHHDHVLWHPSFGPAPRFGSPATVRIVEAERDRLVAAALAPFSGADATAPAWFPDLVGRLQATPHAPASESNVWLPQGVVPAGFEPELVCHDAHIVGHTALWLPEQKILIAGSMLSDVDLPMPDLDSAARVAEVMGWRRFDAFGAYLAGLDALAPYAREARIVIPGHGSLGADAVDRLEQDRAYLEAIIAGGDPSDPRLDSPGMREWHERLREAAARYT